jgi:Arc/MetJ-type ribon-helix-helix transcriptional regulator
MDNNIQMTLPPKLYDRVRELVADGWYRDEAELIFEALRRFVECRRPETLERFIRQDVEWGLHGVD